jgi:hypothetical protein
VACLSAGLDGHSLVRGGLVNWYPYPFLDPTHGGYGSVAGYIVAILIGGALLCLAVAGVHRRIGVRNVS